MPEAVELEVAQAGRLDQADELEVGAARVEGLAVLAGEDEVARLAGFGLVAVGRAPLVPFLFLGGSPRAEDLRGDGVESTMRSSPARVLGLVR